ncbi:aminoglycoside phosphotransferase family protein [Streptomyces sp. 71268]|uniref:phosphotransferase family protein n=1 Tax=Streptomyces sp. 71268 TaxID=3002640 RepID=UPI0023F891D0|nr:aminoglycoside phosphotransferase family protein [Streptomyces sp. 71268]WEV25345.1 aminoglycoside phosphotransferase family protein [Streptomyces sp. 71268]
MDVRVAHRRLLGRLLPADEPGDLVVHEGQFHRVVVGAERVVCLPRSDAAAARLPERAAVLRTLAGLDLGFRTPVPLLAGEPAPDGPGYLVLSRVPGAPLDAGAVVGPGVADVVTDAVAEQYAALLTGLAVAGADAAVRVAVPAVEEDRWRRFAERVRAELYGLMTEAGRRRAERELTALDGLPYRADALVHGDLGAENVLWTRADDGLPRLGGVVDWDEVVIGDPAEDLAAVGASYGAEFAGRVRAYGGWTRPEWDARIDAIRGTFALQQALAAHQDGDAEELADGLAGYR